MPDPFQLMPFFLESGSRRLFAVFSSPCGREATETAVLFCPPFAEENSKARLTAATQSRELAARGVAVLRIDLSCTADSDGEFVDASWEDWVQDIEAGARWLLARGAKRVVAWGVRLGALLAMDWLRQTEADVTGVVLWQPVLAGRQYLKQFLRIRTVADTVGGETRSSVAELLAALQAGQTLEVAGYAVSPRLARQIEALDANEWWRPEMPRITLLEVAQEKPAALTPATEKIVDAGRAAGVGMASKIVVDNQFWRTTEITMAPRLVEETTALVLRT